MLEFGADSVLSSPVAEITIYMESDGFYVLIELVSRLPLEPLTLAIGSFFRETGNIPPLWHLSNLVQLLWVWVPVAS